MTSQMSPGRYERHPHTGQIWDNWGGYWIDEALWQKWLREGRSDQANHDFQLGDRIEEDRPDDPWYRVHAVCAICGEERDVYHRVEMRLLNHGFCIRQPVTRRIRKWWSR